MFELAGTVMRKDFIRYEFAAIYMQESMQDQNLTALIRTSTL